jgi:hypothetical protein
MASILARAPASASFETISTIAAAAGEAELVARYDGRLPRSTSYSTAPHFTSAVGAEVYERWLGGLPLDAALSAYLHVPFRDRLSTAAAPPPSSGLNPHVEPMRNC